MNTPGTGPGAKGEMGHDMEVNVPGTGPGVNREGGAGLDNDRRRRADDRRRRTEDRHDRFGVRQNLR